MTNQAPNSVQIARHLDATPEAVFDAWTDPEMARKWLFATPADEAYTVELDARVGGQYSVTARREGIDYTAVGEYIEIDRPHRLVCTFGMPQFSPLFARLIVEVTPDGDGSMLTLTQEDLPPGYEEATIAGWNGMFDLLSAALA